MSKIDGVEEDLRYVRSVVDEAGKPGSPAGVYYLWAILSFFGMSMIDFKPEAAGPYWAIAGPLGGVASGYLGWRAGRRLGQSSTRDGVLHTLHWTGMMVAILLIVPLPVRGLVTPDVMGSLILLLVAFSYYTAGMYLDRRLFPIGIAMAGCYLITIFISDWAWVWTFTGTVLALGLVANGILAQSAARRTTGGGLP